MLEAIRNGLGPWDLLSISMYTHTHIYICMYVYFYVAIRNRYVQTFLCSNCIYCIMCIYLDLLILLYHSEVTNAVRHPKFNILGEMTLPEDGFRKQMQHQVLTSTNTCRTTLTNDNVGPPLDSVQLVYNYSKFH